ncbi:hypothetical protein JCM19235_3612 [Vibrio maritimus]|uniref:Uncharacterized protein n=1 Tax=Vibrio maritimus TaxID=990268 RepID=A0A090RYS5_9VIBR|nr:hypothetical protein JCM19235_3612 [Vibrio maritimus]
MLVRSSSGAFDRIDRIIEMIESKGLDTKLAIDGAISQMLSSV